MTSPPRYPTVDANEAVADVAYRLSEVIAIYPITRSTMTKIQIKRPPPSAGNFSGRSPPLRALPSPAAQPTGQPGAPRPRRAWAAATRQRSRPART